MTSSKQYAAVLCFALAFACSNALRSSPLSNVLQVPDRVVVSASDALLQPEASFQTFLAQQHRSYPDEQEYKTRLSIFRDNAAYVAAHRAGNAGGSYEMDLNDFADLTWEEFSSTHLGLAHNSSHQVRKSKTTGFSHAAVVPPTYEAGIDWREKGVVTPVKNQLYCGSCWAFSATGAVEGINALYTGKLTSVSEQELVDCDPQSMGCSGGLMDFAFDFIEKNGGIDTEKDYAYYSVGGVCNKFREERTVVSIDGHEDVPVNDEHALRKAVAKQPVSVAICATQALQFYSGGIFGGETCTALNHGVLAVGYRQAEAGKPYWLVKNSWGGGWGEEGYFKLPADVPEKEGSLGICMSASYPLKTTPSPKHLPHVCGYFGWSKCAYNEQCSCRWGLLDLFCFSWGCEDKSEL